MTQIMMAQPVAPAAQTDVSPTGTSNGDQFSSHLNNAIKSGNKSDSKQESEESSKPVENSSPSETPDTTPQTTGKEGAITAGANPSSIGNQTPQLIAKMTPENPFGTGQLVPVQTQLAPVQTELVPVQTDLLAASNSNQPLSSGQVPQTPRIEAPLVSIRNQDSATLELVSSPQLVETQSQNSKGQEGLLATIQKIIDSSSETGIVTVKNVTPQTTQAAATSPETPLQQSSVIIEGNVLKTTGDKSDASLTSLRQDSQHQYYEAKINPLNNSNNSNNSEQNSNSENKQQTENGSPQSPASPQTGLTQTTTGPTSDYAQLATPATQSLTTEPLVDTARPIILPSGAVFTEDDVVQQLVERFQITKRQLETKLNIKLHPAELGELKIDLNVKDGHIRAVVVAQSLHVQEIIEKNLAKLRTVLEDQGFSIEEILVTSESDSVGDFDLFEKNLSGGNNYIQPQMKKDNNYPDGEFILEELTMNQLPSDRGVNIKA